jgi:DNA methylase
VAIFLVDGFHRWQAYRREGISEIAIEDLGNLADIQILKESIQRNAVHGHQLSMKDKQRLASELWMKHFAAMPAGERTHEIVNLLSVSVDSVDRWTKDAKKAEKDALKAKAWDLWLDCLSEREIEQIAGIDHVTASRWIVSKSADAENETPPPSRQHFDLWQFQKADGESSYFGRMPPQVVENLLWFYTKPGDIVVDPFAGGGTIIDVCKAMGRRVWASDLTPSTPMLPIHKHNILDGWSKNAPNRAALIILDPPYWQQAEGKYSDLEDDLGNMTHADFLVSWSAIIRTCSKHKGPEGRIAYIISPTQCDDGSVVDHATEMLRSCWENGLSIERRIIVQFQTQQANGQQVEWARENKRMLKLYRDLIVLK